MCEITVRDGIYKRGKVMITFVSDGTYDREVIAAEAKRLLRFLEKHISNGMRNALFDLMLEERANAQGYSIGEGGE